MTCRRLACGVAVFTLLHVPAAGQTTTARRSEASATVSATPPADYLIGADDLLTIRFWGDAQLSVDVAVRPDGKISVPLLDDVEAAGLTPEQLNKKLETAASKYIADPDATVIVREIRSRKIFILGQVAKPGPVPLNTAMNVLQALTVVGGLLEYADKSNIVVVRNEKGSGSEQRFKFNYNEVFNGKNLHQNILLRPNDTILVK